MSGAARWARAEWGPLYAAVRGPLLERRLRAVPMTLAAVCLTGLLQWTQNQPWGHLLVQRLGAVRAAEPLWLALLRTPLSLFVPAPDLPVWGALAQILCVFGTGEICLGRRRTLAVAYAATLAGTLYARLGIALGPHRPFGLPGSDAWVVDTGPSAAVVGLAVHLGWRYGAYATTCAVTLAMAAEVALKGNLAGKEHMAALAVVGLGCAWSAVREGRSRQGWPLEGGREGWPRDGGREGRPCAAGHGEQPGETGHEGRPPGAGRAGWGEGAARPVARPRQPEPGRPGGSRAGGASGLPPIQS